jgi:hypothetical protein
MTVRFSGEEEVKWYFKRKQDRQRPGSLEGHGSLKQEFRKLRQKKTAKTWPWSAIQTGSQVFTLKALKTQGK